eukprot:TRINITY_DN7449_c0_g2_i2.p1 TRINITY_DN7449_c0_g2~~TRINITY_DN7449_c0_g2_i2.p1  ORF type:complete len:425 (+),score=125.50 TRINITY_DN7449_c0_g2_i2:103-1377(+)
MTTNATVDRKARCVFVTNVADSVKESNLREMFNFCGAIVGLKRQYIPELGTLGYEIEFEKVRAAQAATQLHGVDIVGQRLSVQVQQYVGPQQEDVARAKKTEFMHEVVTAAYHMDRGMEALSTDLLLERANAAAREAAAAKDQGTDPYAQPTSYEDQARADRTVFVSRTDRRVTRAHVYKHFKDCGDIAHVIAGLNKEDGTYYALVEFALPLAARAALGKQGVEVIPGVRVAVQKSPVVIVRSTATTPPEIKEDAPEETKSEDVAKPDAKEEDREKEKAKEKEKDPRRSRSRSSTPGRKVRGDRGRRRSPERGRRRSRTRTPSSASRSESLGRESPPRERHESRRGRGRSDSRDRSRRRGRSRSASRDYRRRPSYGDREYRRRDSRDRYAGRDRYRDRSDRRRSPTPDRRYRRRSDSRDRYRRR